MKYEIPTEHRDSMSPAQVAVVESMLANHERLKYLVDRIVPRDPALLLAMRMRFGIEADNLWLALVNRLAMMDPSTFDELLVELSHYIRKGMGANLPPPIEDEAADAIAVTGAR